MTKRFLGIAVAVVMLLGIFALAACEPLGEKIMDETTWTNDNAVYAYIKAGHEKEILKNIDGAFNSLSFKKIYVIEKNVGFMELNLSTGTPLILLFILEENGVITQQEFIELLKQDVRVDHASSSRDLYFETVDTRHIDKAKDIISVGEELILEAKGYIDYYIQPFGFEGFLVKPVKNKTYTVASFPQVDLKSVEKKENGWLYLELATEGYFEVIKAVNDLARLSTIDKVSLDRSEIFLIPPPEWGISDRSIADFESKGGGEYPTAVIKGLKAGNITVYFDDVTCAITVI
ncbi:MAG: hypothetical protein FWH03_03305 [Firmicutes bacterium]|nr:hypothetical protein [Bacillota bacterium]